jgi:phospholipid transport system substrate-binding protein
MRLGVLLMGVCLFSQSVLAAASPLDSVKGTADAVLTTLRDPQFKSDRDNRQERIKALLRARFDFEEMAKRSLGPNWAKQSAADQQQFVKQFTELLMNSYIGRIDDYHGEKIIYGAERRDGDLSTVHTKIQDNENKEFSIDYRLVQRGDDWKIFDVVVEDISLINNYRSQFSRLLNNGSFADLLQKIATKQVQSPGASKF